MTFAYFPLPGPWRRLRDLPVPTDIRNSRLHLALHRVWLPLPLPHSLAVGKFELSLAIALFPLALIADLLLLGHRRLLLLPAELPGGQAPSSQVSA